MADGEPVRATEAMIGQMSPSLDTQGYVFVTDAAPVSDALATFREREGLSQILPIEAARAAGLDISMPMARVVLEVHSALDGVGLTAAVASALASQGIACNMVAAFHHDYVFVPLKDAARALTLLQRLQSGVNSG